MTIKAQDVKELREKTGLGMMECKKALQESNGNLDEAIKNLRKSSALKAEKKASRTAIEGVILSKVADNEIIFVEVNCETDFVAKNENFISFVKELGDLNNKCSSNLDDLSKSKMENEKTVDENLVALIAKIGEKITIGRAKTIKYKNSKNFSYQHSIIKDNVSKLGVIVSIDETEKSENINTFGKQLAMHIAASNPIALNSDDIDKEVIDKEQQLITEELKNSGKPEEIAKKISLGKLNKFKEENSLMSQDWVMEPKKKSKRCFV